MIYNCIIYIVFHDILEYGIRIQYCIDITLYDIILEHDISI